jgi:hypothetical protein
MSGITTKQQQLENVIHKIKDIKKNINVLLALKSWENSKLEREPSKNDQYNAEIPLEEPLDIDFDIYEDIYDFCVSDVETTFKLTPIKEQKLTPEEENKLDDEKRKELEEDTYYSTALYTYDANEENTNYNIVSGDKLHTIAESLISDIINTDLDFIQEMATSTNINRDQQTKLFEYVNKLKKLRSISDFIVRRKYMCSITNQPIAPAVKSIDARTCMSPKLNWKALSPLPPAISVRGGGENRGVWTKGNLYSILNSGGSDVSRKIPINDLDYFNKFKTLFNQIKEETVEYDKQFIDNIDQCINYLEKMESYNISI